jgi:hypothetical protein
LSKRAERFFSKKTIRCCQRRVRNDYARLLRPAGSSFSDRLSRQAWKGESPCTISGEQMSSRELTQSAQVNSNTNGRYIRAGDSGWNHLFFGHLFSVATVSDICLFVVANNGIETLFVITKECIGLFFKKSSPELLRPAL